MHKIINFNIICIDTKASHRQNLNKRLLRHFNHLKMMEYDIETISKIYQSIMYSYLR